MMSYHDLDVISHWVWGLEMKPRWLWALVAVSTVLTLRVFFKPAEPPDFEDFAVYYTAGLKAFVHQTVYDVPSHYQCKYSPFVALFFGMTFSRLSYAVSCVLLYVCNVALWTATMLLYIREVLSIFPKLWERFAPANPIVVAFPLVLLFFAVGLRDELIAISAGLLLRRSCRRMVLLQVHQGNGG